MEQTPKIEKKKRDRVGIVLYLIYVALLIASLLLIGRLISIQIFYKPDPRMETALTPRSTVDNLEPNRGNVIDCNGRLLAISCPNYQFYMDCTVLKDSNTAEQEEAWLAKAKQLSKALSEEFNNKTADQYYRLITEGRKKGKKYQKITDWVDHNTYSRVIQMPLFREGRYKSGMIVETRNIRQYPYGTLARRTIGFVRDNSSQVANTHIGLEGKFDYILHGKEGREYTRETDYGKVRNSDSTRVVAEDGKDIRTTINIDYQELADKALRDQIEGESDLEAACLVLMEVKTGAIRAMVNLQRDEKSGKFSEIKNLAIGRKNEPGSVFKTVTLLSVLNDGYIRSLEETLPATNGHVEGTKINDSHIPEFARNHHTNRISIIDGFKISSNYVFATLAVKNYGKSPKLTDKFLSNIHSFKLAEAYDFDLDGMETPTIPARADRNPWTNTDLATIGYGYSTSVTPLHTLSFYNAIANKGKMMKPYLVEDIEKDGKIVQRRGPAILNAAICTKAVADTVTRALKAVTEEGTAKRLRGAKCTVAGKTGTSFGTYENGKYIDAAGRRKYQGTFVGFFPAEKPEYSIICVVYSRPTNSHFQGGGKPAAAIRTVIDQIYDIDPSFRPVIRKKNATR